MTTRRWFLIGVIFLSVAFSVWAAAFIFRSSFIASDGLRYFSLSDDAMISMRYAWNLSHGSGLVWNPGERVEGYTNLLMVLLMAVWTGAFDRATAVLAVQASAIPVLLGIAVLSMLHWNELARGNDIHHGDTLAALAFLVPLLYYPLLYWTLMGMETGLLTLLLMTGSLLFLVHLRRGGYRELVAGSLALGLGYLARPDSAATAALMLMAATLMASGTMRRRLSAMSLGAATYVLLPAAQAGFRLMYYGELVPLTYTLKLTGMAFGERLQNGLMFIDRFVSQSQWAFLLAALGAVARFSRRKVFLLIPPITLLVGQVLIGGDPWPRWRLLAPGIPFLLILMLTLADWLITHVGRLASARSARATPLSENGGGSPRPAARLAPLILGLAGGFMMLTGLGGDVFGGSPGMGLAQRYLLLGGAMAVFLATTASGRLWPNMIAFAILILALVPLNAPFLKEATLWRVPYQVDENREHVDVAVAINRWTTQEASIGVFSAGTIPYYASRYAIDFLGKNDPYIARLPADVSGAISWNGLDSVPGHNKYDLEYSILQRRPTYVQAFRWGSEDLTHLLNDVYVEVTLPGLNVAFRRDDPSVRWELIPANLLVRPDG